MSIINTVNVANVHQQFTSVSGAAAAAAAAAAAVGGKAENRLRNLHSSYALITRYSATPRGKRKYDDGLSGSR
jgi:hypothetical protein